MDRIEQQLRATRDKLRARKDWRPGRDVLPDCMAGEVGIYSQQVEKVHMGAVIREADDIIYTMMGDS